MSRALIESLRGRRWVFVVGKGGVGKTTAAAALALELADAGETTRLISTDPAHSLTDVFGAQASASGASPCSDRLVLEELDADAFAAEWRRCNAPALAELLERGTYLDSDDVDRFVRLSLPGADEIMAALRLAELGRGSMGRVVVDTAPTGHTVRLLDAGATLAGWGGAFEAMRAKADAVAGALVGRAASEAGAAALERLVEDVDGFERGVLQAASFIVVTRDELVVREETGRLRAELERRSLAPVVELCIDGREGEGEAFRAPWRPSIAGCDGLRAYAKAIERVAPGRIPGTVAGPAADDTMRRRGRPAASADVPAVEALLAGPRLLFFAGKGGVGKSTCAAAAAVGLGLREPVRLYGTDPAGSLAGVLGVTLPEEGAPVAPGVWSRQVDAGAELERFRRLYLEKLTGILEALGLDAVAPLDRRVLESMRNLVPPGMDEIFAIASLAEDEGRLVIDSAPTGHFLRLLEMPEVGLGWLHALMRVVLRYGRGEVLEAMGEQLLAAARTLKRLDEMLRGGDAGVVLVTLDEPIVIVETRRLGLRLREARVPILAWLLNRDREASGAVARAAEEWGVPLLRAPEVRPSPCGASALLEFFHAWRVS